MLFIHNNYSHIFFADENIDQVDVHVYGILIPDIPIPFPFNKPDACKDLTDGLTCPLHKDQEYNYTTSLFVQKKFPSVTSTFYIYSFLYLYLLFRNLFRFDLYI